MELLEVVTKQGFSFIKRGWCPLPASELYLSVLSEDATMGTAPMSTGVVNMQVGRSGNGMASGATKAKLL